MPTVFRSEEHEPITQELIRELVEAGWEERTLKECQEAGMSFCRERNSFVSTPQAFGNFH